MTQNSDPGYARLLLLVGGIAADVKSILTRQDRQDNTIDRVEVRIEKLEAFRWKLVGVAIAAPTLLTLTGLYFTGS